MEEAAFQDAAPAYTVPSKRSTKRFIYLIIAVIVLVLLFVLGSRFLGSSKKQAQKITPTPTVKITPTETPTPSGETSPTPSVKPTNNPVDKATGLNRAKLSVLVENGSGVAGAAGDIANVLKNLGYTISSTGNADNFDYSGVTIQVKTGSSDYLDLLKSDLSGKYTITSTSSDLSATISADALVIIGK